MGNIQKGKKRHANRSAKDTVFGDLFSDRENLLRLYRALHPEDTGTVTGDLRHVTIRNVLTRGRYNDLGFMVGERLVVLVEAQSTWSANIIPRCVMYLAETWGRYFAGGGMDLYGAAPVMIPEPELYVIYTGTRRIGKENITLSGEFFGGRDTAVNAKVRVLEYDGGADIINQYIAFCRTLDRQRALHSGDGVKAVAETLRLCISAGILSDYFSRHTEEVTSIMLTLYSQEQATQMMLASERKESRMEGLREGLREGELKTTVRMCQEFDRTYTEAVAMLTKRFGLSEAEAVELADRYWVSE